MKIVEFLVVEGIDIIIEVGLGKVLIGLGKCIVKLINYFVINIFDMLSVW